ncbi:probable O-methyltransferase 3 [Mangifera indica]|uniref:probable O-methyltransferase 3 n=1 Tax=Mangifera indica TaxID=29780 RepID=UPI001CFB8B62|nr:probable O-methyltransferase 3 [Mangifera indica]
MQMVCGEHDYELLRAQSHVWNHIFSFINSMSLKCAIQLCIPDVIHNHGKPMTITQLVTALPVHPSKTIFVYRLMRILAHSNFFTLTKTGENDEEEEYAYGLTTSSQLLLKDNSLSARPFLMAMLDPVLTTPWNHLSSWFQNGEYSTPFDIAHGMKFWEYVACKPNINHLFNEAMASDARLVISVVIEKCEHVFKGLKSLIDVGGGTGAMVKAIVKAFPQVECTVFDLPHVVSDMQSHGNLKYIGGNMFDVIPSADAVLLKWILHDWNDEECVKILKKCKEAISSNGKTGKVIIIDMLFEKKEKDDKSTETQLFFDMLMMLLLTGKERDEREWAKLFLDAGFTRYEVNPILGLRSLIELYP